MSSSGKIAKSWLLSSFSFWYHPTFMPKLLCFSLVLAKNLPVHPAQHTWVLKLHACCLSPLVWVSSSLSSGWRLCRVADFPLSYHCADACIAGFHLTPFGASCSGREEKWRNKTGKRRRGKRRTDIRLFLKEMFLVVLSCRSSTLTFNTCQFYVECNLRVFCTLFC